MTLRNRKTQDNLFIIVFILIILFRIWIITGIPKLLDVLRLDDTYYAKIAHNIIRWNWLGPYSQTTIIKAPFYAFFIILSFFSGLPLYFNENIFYLFAAGSLYLAIKPVIKNRWWRLLLFAIIVFNPTSLSTYMNLRVYREFVYNGLTLFVLACLIGTYLRLEDDCNKLVYWIVGLAISLGAFFITKEESVWIIPVLVLFTFLCLIRINKSKRKDKIRRILTLFLILAFMYLPLFTVSCLNYTHYGFWGISENLNDDYLSIRNTLTSIQTDKTCPHRPISKEALVLAYQASPSLNELSDYIDKQYDTWMGYSDKSIQNKPDWYLNQYFVKSESIGNGHFMWMLRDAIADQGYYSNGKFPSEEINKIARELQSACETGELPCQRTQGLPLIGSINSDNLPLIIRFFFYHIYELCSQSKISIMNLDVSLWPDNHRDFEYFHQFIYNPIEYKNFGNTDADAQIVGGSTDARFKVLPVKEAIMQLILDIYQLLSLPFFFITAVATIISIVRKDFAQIFQGHGTLLLIPLSLLLVRLGMLAVIDATTSIPASNYSWSIYSVFYSTVFFALYDIINFYIPKFSKFLIHEIGTNHR